MRRLLFGLVCVVAPAILIAPAAADEGVVFRASFDKSIAPETANGGPATPFSERDTTKLALVPGQVGNGVQVEAGRRLIYEGEGNAYVAAGTLSFFWRPDANPIGKEFIVIDMGVLEPVNRFRFFSVGCDGVTLVAAAPSGPGGRLMAKSLRGRLKQGEWHHIAMTWDQPRGFGLYVDGKPAGVHAEPWVFEGNFNHISLGVETRPDFRPSGGAKFGQSYDELTVFDRWLSDEAIATLAEGKTPKIGALDDARWLAQKRALYGWQHAGDVKPSVAVAPDAQGIGLKQAGVARARDVKRSSWMVFDGERARHWPGPSGYHDRGRALDFTLHPNASFDAVQMLVRGALRLAPAGQDNPLVNIPGDGPKELQTLHFLLAAPTTGSEFRVERPAPGGGALYEMNLFRAIPFDTQAGAGAGGWQRHALAPLDEAAAKSDEMTWMRRTFWTPDQAAFSAGAAPAEGKPAAVAKLPAMRTVHVLGPAHKEWQALGAIALDLGLMSDAGTNVLRIDVIDPLNPERYATTADVRLTGGRGRLRILMDVRDLVFRPNARPRIALTFRNAVDLDLASSVIAYKQIGVPEALKEFSPDQLARAHYIFQTISEARPWSYAPEALKRLRALRNGIDALHTLQPKDEAVCGYWNWIHPGEQKPVMKFPEVPPGIPAWAVYLDRAIEQCKQVPYWWIANRENAFGEFGANDGINDDTDLVQDWWALHLMRGPDKLLHDSLQRVADNSWYNKMRESGLGGFTDALHTYEDGPNAQCHMALMDYGNPVYMERLFKAVGFYKEMMAVYPKCGHLHFRMSHYGHNAEGGLQSNPAKYGWDDGDNTLALHQAMLIGWYNGNTNCKQTVVDWTDGMIAHSLSQFDERQRLAAVKINMTTGEERVEVVNPGFGYGFFSAVWAAYEFTGDKKYLDFIRLGMESDLRAARNIHQTGHVADRYVQASGDCRLQDRFIAATKREELWQKSLHNGNYHGLDSFYLAWQCTGDLGLLTEGIKLTLNEITWELPMLTVGEQSTDRVWVPQRLIDRVALGGGAMLRNELFPCHAVSWEHATGRVAPMVKLQDRQQLQAWIANLEDKPVTVSMRVWRLDHGRYELTEGLDANQDGVWDAAAKPTPRTLELARFDAVPVTVPAQSVWYIACKQVEALDDIRQRADLAVCAQDAKFEATNGTLKVRVHNIGSKASGPYTVRATVGDRVVLEQAAPSLEAPLDCLPRTADFKIQAGDGRQMVTLEVDPGKAVPEIAEANNVVKFVPAMLPPPWPIVSKQ